MAKEDFTSENKVVDSIDFPQLKLDHGERARIVAIEKAPEMQFLHTLRAPMIGEDGLVMKESKTTKNGGSRMVTKTSFVGTHLCAGRYDTLKKEGIDPEKCVTCRAAEQEEGIDPPTRRYAMHVLQYAVQPNSFKVQTASIGGKPMISMATRVWKFPAQRFATLADLNEEHDSTGGLKGHDLLLGPCENKDFQKYDIHAAAEAIYLKDGDWVELAKSTYANNRTPDLIAMIGQRKTVDQMRDDINVVLDKVAQVNGKTSSATSSSSAPSTDDVAGILDGVDDMAATQQPQSSNIPPGLDLDTMFDKSAPIGQPVASGESASTGGDADNVPGPDDGSSEEVATPDPTPESQPETAAQKPPEKDPLDTVPDFDSIADGLLN